MPMPMPMPEELETEEETIDRIFTSSNDSYFGLGFVNNPENKQDKYGDNPSPAEQQFKSFVYKYYLG